ncbi:MAG: hypothetical protein SGJ00_08910 [bacterium]|nr:hypothetical protein [bacterium]
MKKLLSIGLIAVLMASACGIRMHQMNLIDEWGNTYEQSAVKVFQDREIYHDQTVDVWGMEQTACKNFARVDSVSYNGKSSIGLVWNREGSCPWVGMGIGWNGYAAKDLSEVMQTGSIDFYVRAVAGKQFIPTLIFLLEDYSGVQSATLLKAKHLELYPITETWQRVSIPLSGFLLSSAPLCDFSNIKSLNIECQGAGAIYIDEISVGGASIKAGSTEKFGVASTTKFPAMIFQDAVTYAWGLGNLPGRNIELVESEKFAGEKSLHLVWNEQAAPKGNKQMGFNWAQWQAISLADSVQTYSIEFYVKANDKAALTNLMFGFESYNGKAVLLPIAEKYLKDAGSSWQKVAVPMGDFDWEKSGFDIKRFKQFLIQFKGEGAAWIDEISLNKRN